MKLYFKFLAMHLKSRMAYRKSFFLSIIGQFLTSFSAFAVVFFLLVAAIAALQLWLTRRGEVDA